nr:MAG TPA: hypothetical protein [Caudoviricetes sp.]
MLCNQKDFVNLRRLFDIYGSICYNNSVRRAVQKKPPTERGKTMTDKAKSAALFEQHRQMTKAWEAQMDALAKEESITDEEYEQKLMELYNQHKEKADAVWLKAFALRFPKRKGWFADVFAPSFGICENKKLSPKQTQVFIDYCISDADTWRNGNTYCRFGDKLVTLTRPRYANGCGYVTIRQL